VVEALGRLPPGEGSVIRFALKRAVWYSAVLVAVNAVAYGVVAYLAIRRFGQLRIAHYDGRELLISDPNVRASVSLSEVRSVYATYFAGLVHGNLGTSINGQPVVSIVAHALPRSLLLLGLALLVAAVVGITLGYLAFDRRTGRARSWTVTLNIAGFAAPAFYLGILILLVLWKVAVWTGWRGLVLPAAGFGVDRHLILPVLILAVRPATEVARLTGDLLADELAKPYMRAVAAKGLTWRRQVLHHAFRNVATVVALHLDNATRYLLSSLVAVELLFSWNGVGMTLARAIAPRIDGRPSSVTLFDPALVAGLVTAMAVLAIAVDFGTATVTRLLDPRLRD
jgi:peptide/nickel transport system permease protein